MPLQRRAHLPRTTAPLSNRVRPALRSEQERDQRPALPWVLFAAVSAIEMPVVSDVPSVPPTAQNTGAPQHEHDARPRRHRQVEASPREDLEEIVRARQAA